MKKLQIFLLFFIVSLILLSCEKPPNVPILEGRTLIVTDGYVDVTITEHGTGDYYLMQFYFFTKKYQTNLIVTNGSLGDPIDIFTQKQTRWLFKNRKLYINNVYAATYTMNGSRMSIINVMTKKKRVYIISQRDNYFYFTGPNTESGFRVNPATNPIDSLVEENKLRDYLTSPFEDYSTSTQTTLLFHEKN